MEALIGALGVIAGGLIATGGAVFVNRRELTRQHRVELFLEVLPQLLEVVERGAGEPTVAYPQLDLVRAGCARVRRQTVVAGRGDRVHGDRVEEHARAVAVAAADVGYGAYGVVGDLKALQAAMVDLEGALVEYAGWLEVKIR
jgi:hypothetical protein